LADNFKFKDERWSNTIGKFEGSWQLSIRNIDPSCLLKDKANAKPDDVPQLLLQTKEIYNAWDKKLPHKTWLKKDSDLPNPRQLIELGDDKGVAWLILEGSYDWEDETPPEQEKYDLETRKMWYMFKSYLIKKPETEKAHKWLTRQRFMNRWMPESHDFYNVHLGEYPWASAFLFQYIPYYHHAEWTTRTSGNKKLPAKVLVTDDEYLSSGSNLDCSTPESCHVKLPAKWIIDKMKLRQKYVDGRFYDKENNLVAFDPSIFDEDFPRFVLMRKDVLLAFLKQKGCKIVWTLQGEKNLIGGGHIGQPKGWLEMNGSFVLNEKNKVIGSMWSSFSPSR
jgi:hypothetical protein